MKNNKKKYFGEGILQMNKELLKILSLGQIKLSSKNLRRVKLSIDLCKSFINWEHFIWILMILYLKEIITLQ